MKTLLKHALALALAAFVAEGTLIASAEKPERTGFDATVPARDPVYDVDGNPAVAGDTPLYADSSGFCDHLFPILLPDGHHVTLAEWTQVQGSAMAKCVEKGTHVELTLSGLIPHGVYTIWVGVFQAPGLTPDFSNMIALGALGLPEGSQNAFVASAAGKAELSAFQPSDPLSVFDDQDADNSCLLDKFEVGLFAALHVDGQTYGPVPGPDDCALAISGAFRFKR